MRENDTELCPICGCACGFLYVRGSEIVGCERCVVMLELWETEPRERG